MEQGFELLYLNRIHFFIFSDGAVDKCWEVGSVAVKKKSPEIAMNVLGCCVCSLATTELMMLQTAIHHSPLTE